MACHVIFPRIRKCYKSATGFTTGIGKVRYIIWIKDFFKETNIRKTYERQILDYNVEKFSLIIRDDIDMFLSTEILTQVDKNTVLQVNSISGTMKIEEELRWHIERNK